jgi:hypothetical protein
MPEKRIQFEAVMPQENICEERDFGISKGHTLFGN